MKAFHTPSFGEEFDVSAMPVMQQTMSHQMDQYAMSQQQQAPPSQQSAHSLGNYDDAHYMWQQNPSPMYMNNTSNYASPLDPQMNAYGVYPNDQGQMHSHNNQMQMHTQQTHAPAHPLQAQQTNSAMPQMQQYQQMTNHHHMVNHQVSSQQQQDDHNHQQMLMMPPPYKSPPMTQSQQQQHQMMNSPTINQSPHYMTPSENGTTSEDSDDSGLRGNGNPLKRPSPEPLNESPSKAGKTSSSSTASMAAKKPKAQRKKKKKDPNEPQKPVSAYALFFRDTQSAIKGEKPNASFGEVSTIVASMWDGLEPERKEVYKRKQEAAKKDYLKTLAAYRASAVSKGNDAESASAGSTSPQQVSSQQPSLPNQQQQSQLQTSQSPSSASVPAPSSQAQAPSNSQGSSPSQSISHPQQAANQQSNNPPYIQQQSQQSPLNQSNMHSQQQTSYQQPPYMPSSYKPPPSNQLDYNNMSMMHPSHQIAIVRPMNTNQSPHGYGYDQPPMDPYMGQSHGTHPTHLQNHTSAAQQQQQQQQQQQHALQNHNHHSGAQQIAPNLSNCDNLGSPSYNNNFVINNNNSLSNQQHQQTTMPAPHQQQLHQMQSQPVIQQCIRHGCTNQATVHPDWEDEYCSSECVVTHCRNVFSNWIQMNNTSPSQLTQQQNYSAVK